jgi:hypothetical protein
MDGSVGIRAWVALCVVTGLLAGAGTGAAATALAPGAGNGNGFADASAGGAAIPATQIEADQVVVGVRLHPNGTATWSAAYRIRLRTENDTAAFEGLRADVEANGTRYASRFAAGIEGTVADAENRTGREMNATGFAVRTDRRQLPREYGVVTYRFRWEGFAAVDGDRIVVSEVLSGFFLDDSTRLAVSWPDGYRVVDAGPDPDERREHGAVWVGPLDFPVGTPRVVVAPAATAGGGGGGDGSGDGGGGSGGDAASDAAGGRELLVSVLVAALVAAVVAIAAYRRFGGRVEDASAPPESGVATPAGNRGGGGAGGAPSGTGATEGGEPADGSNPPEELLSNEEQVLRFLASEGGRAKQQDVVAALDWTEARTSQVVNGMEAESEIEKFRIGRENVLKLPEEEEDVGAE